MPMGLARSTRSASQCPAVGGEAEPTPAAGTAATQGQVLSLPGPVGGAGCWWWGAGQAAAGTHQHRVSPPAEPSADLGLSGGKDQTPRGWGHAGGATASPGATGIPAVPSACSHHSVTESLPRLQGQGSPVTAASEARESPARRGEAAAVWGILMTGTRWEAEPKPPGRSKDSASRTCMERKKHHAPERLQ